MKLERITVYRAEWDEADHAILREGLDGLYRATLRDDVLERLRKFGGALSLPEMAVSIAAEGQVVATQTRAEAAAQMKMWNVGEPGPSPLDGVTFEGMEPHR